MAALSSLHSTSTAAPFHSPQRTRTSRGGCGMAMATVSRPIRNSSGFLLLHLRCRFVPQYSNPAGYYSSKAGLGSNVESTGAPSSVPVRVAHELLQAGHRYLDVRTLEEFSSGHVPGAMNIPYMLKVREGMTKNTKFLDKVSQHFGKDDEILVGCQSGRRSLMASTDLQAAGYTGVIDISGGYASWKQNGLPTEP